MAQPVVAGSRTHPLRRAGRGRAAERVANFNTRPMPPAAARMDECGLDENAAARANRIARRQTERKRRLKRMAAARNTLQLPLNF
jgi:hypothetical protein